MSKIMSEGVFHTAMGRFLVFPCGCKNGEDLEHDPKKDHKAVLAVANNGKYAKPVWHTFETDYVFEDRPREVEIED